MADRDSEGHSPTKELGIFLLFIFVLAIIWFVQGGSSKIPQSFLMSPPYAVTSISTGEEASSTEENLPEAIPGSKTTSFYKGKIFLNAVASRETDPQKEYVKISAYSLAEPALITGWTLMNRRGESFAIGAAASFVFSGQVNIQNPIYLKPNETAVITTGQSPIGTSFRLNICTGYFNQFQEFSPRLAEDCPRLLDSDIPVNFPNACFDFARDLPRCRMPMSIPPEAGNDCAVLVNEKINYNNCVASHKNEGNFYKPEWRIYLGRDKEIWDNEREYIILRDQEGEIIDVVSYSY